MTTKLEKQFFETFNIPKIFKTTINIGDLDTNYEEIQAPTLKELYEEARFDFETPIYFSWFKRSKRWSEEYPQITDKQYLELICAYNNFQNDTASFFIPFDYKNIKNNLLTFLIEEINEKYKNSYFDNDVDKLKHQVQAIFEGER